MLRYFTFSLNSHVHTGSLCERVTVPAIVEAEATLNTEPPAPSSLLQCWLSNGTTGKVYVTLLYIPQG